MSDEEHKLPWVDHCLEPIAGDAGPCGPDLEYDNAMLALSQAAAGKPETQFDAGVPPDWRIVREQAEALLERSRDLRIAMLWVRAVVHLDGFAALPEGVRLLNGLLVNFWEGLHPLPDPDDGDPYARMNALGPMREVEGLLGDLRNAVLVQQRGVGEMRVRAVEVALNLLPAKDDEAAFSKDQVMQMLADAALQNPALRELPRRAIEQVEALRALLDDRGGIDAPDLKPLLAMLKSVASVMPPPPRAPDEAAAGDGADDGSTDGTASTSGGVRLSGGVRNRDDALRAIDMVCEFLERTEPTSPAPLLLRRARRMINRNFLQLMKELAPDALAEVARVMGVDPETVSLDEPS